MRLTDEQIGAELRGLRETPSEDFAARMDRRVAAGFPAPELARRGRELTWGRLLPALGSLAAIAIVVVVISSSGGGGGGTSASAPTAAPSGTAAPAAGPETSERLEPFRDQATNGTAAATRPRNARPQVQERTAQVGLATDANKLEDAANGVVDVTDRYDGIVDSSTVHVGGSNGHASFSLRIPTQHLNDALTDLSDLGRVTTRDMGSTNVTGAYVDVGKAYADARNQVNALREQLQTASPPAALKIRSELDTAQQNLAATRRALRSLKQRVAYTPVSVEITAQGDGSWSIGDAADDAVGVLEAIAGAALIALAVLVPLAALIALGYLGTRELNRRRREAALDR